MGALNDPAGPVDRYLDEMFDRLAGTGAAGRRLLTEAEDHLRAATADGQAQGLDGDAAEREAVTRFGAPDTVVTAATGGAANLVLRAGAGIATIAAAVLVVTAAAAPLGWVIAHGFAWLLLASDGFGVVDMTETCREAALSCSTPPTSLVAEWFLASVVPLTVAAWCLAIASGLAGAVALLHRHSVSTSWAPRRRATATAATVLFGGCGSALLALSVFEAAAGPWADLPGHLGMAFAALAACLVASRHRRRAAGGTTVWHR